MSRNSKPAPPPEVIQALETVERAKSAVQIGREYQILLDWRRVNPGPGITLNFMPFVWAAIAVAIVLWGIPLIGPWINFELTEFWRGFFFGGLVWSLMDQFIPWRRRAAESPSIEARIQAAIDRWRHAVPAMLEMPK